MIITTLFAKIKILSRAINCRSPILAITTRILAYFKLFLFINSKIDFIFNLILPVLFDKKIILKGLSILW